MRGWRTKRHDFCAYSLIYSPVFVHQQTQQGRPLALGELFRYFRGQPISYVCTPLSLTIRP